MCLYQAIMYVFIPIMGKWGDNPSSPPSSTTEWQLNELITEPISQIPVRISEADELHV